MGDSDLPAGFVRFRLGTTEAIARGELTGVIHELLRDSTLYEYGARHPLARRFAGRGVAYAVALPNGENVVIRHSRHGGTFGRLRRDLFLAPTRAPRELRISERLREAGIPTPPVVACAVYHAGPLLRRADVVTREIPDAFDLAVALMSDDPALRSAALATTAALIRSLASIGGRHPDLNVKNVLLQRGANGDLAGYLLDVDRVVFLDDRAAALRQNLARLLRSAAKWRVQYGALVTESELAAVSTVCRAD